MKLMRAILLGGGVLAFAALLAGALLFVLLDSGTLTTQRSVPLTPEQIFADASRSVVMVYAADASRKIVGRGSGVFMHQDLLVTNCHVIARGTNFRVGHKQQHWPARLVAHDTDRDLCALGVEGLDVTPARVGDTGALRVGQRVYAIGTPEGFELTFSEGLISGLRQARFGQYIQTTAPLSDGSSGGGLFDSHGRLIGITSFVFSHGQNLNFAAPAEWAADLAKKAAVTGDAAPAREVELPPGYAKQWRHPLLK